MKNFIFACISVVLLVAGTVLSSAAVRGYTEDTLELIEAEDYDGALLLFEQKRDLLSLAVNGSELERLEESLIDLASGQEGAKKKAVSVCKELESRERLCFAALF